MRACSRVGFTLPQALQGRDFLLAEPHTASHLGVKPLALSVLIACKHSISAPPGASLGFPRDRPLTGHGTLRRHDQISSWGNRAGRSGYGYVDLEGQPSVRGSGFHSAEAGSRASVSPSIYGMPQSAAGHGRMGNLHGGSRITRVWRHWPLASWHRVHRQTSIHIRHRSHPAPPVPQMNNGFCCQGIALAPRRLRR